MTTERKTVFDQVMQWPATTGQNLRHAVPFFHVTDLEASLRFYVEGLGFALVRQWDPDGRISWCWLERDGVAIMLQEYWRDGRPGGAPAGPLGQGVSIKSERTQGVAAGAGVRFQSRQPALDSATVGADVIRLSSRPDYNVLASPAPVS